jgi:hypothetical protein
MVALERINIAVRARARRAGEVVLPTRPVKVGAVPGFTTSELGTAPPDVRQDAETSRDARIPQQSSQ